MYYSQWQRDPDRLILIPPGPSSFKGLEGVSRVYFVILYCMLKINVGDTFAHCSLCGSDFSVSHGGKHDVSVHIYGKCHKAAASAASSSRSMASFFKPQLRQSVTEAVARRALFTANHNLSFLSSDHASKQFKTMFPDSEIAKAFA